MLQYRTYGKVFYFLNLKKTQTKHKTCKPSMLCHFLCYVIIHNIYIYYVYYTFLCMSLHYPNLVLHLLYRM